ncbi:heme-dependent oxidative N-demethylase subunit alpha family protein [Pseudomonas sp. 5P_3.1_Bac2]|uniref:heme-dependent oxidative N-demethylase subunit alpha family protein n=1 Tax=Pseudomonas sp. 5P_3.1_Bac2 TaxID=2971617 RepID=UPI0029057A34|nr:heme-dependent oxidative N-demethylase subunit alpha family protein [Pseudomonas sp. 5P_3.1_Bac2]
MLITGIKSHPQYDRLPPIASGLRHALVAQSSDGVALLHRRTGMTAARYQQTTLLYSREPFSGQDQGEFVVLEERDNTLYIGTGMATQRADYSLRFNLDISFMEFHGPVPNIQETAVLDRGLKFRLHLHVDHPMRRGSGSVTVHPRVETSAETLPDWVPDRTTVTAENAGELVNLFALHATPQRGAVSDSHLFGEPGRARAAMGQTHALGAQAPLPATGGLQRLQPLSRRRRAGLAAYDDGIPVDIQAPRKIPDKPLCALLREV